MSSYPEFKLHNTLSRSRDLVNPLEPGRLRVYACGPTVYSYAHIGNFRSFLTADLVVRVAKSIGYDVAFVSNITDVGHLTEDDLADAGGEDKMERALRSSEGREFANIWDLARYYAETVLEDWKTLNLSEPSVRPRASEHVTEQLEMIRDLIAKGYAYETPKGVYFDIVKFPRYGELSGNTLSALVAGSRELVVDSEKKNPQDFALWKKDEKHLMRWHSPFGWGFPGWHIECSAMAKKYLGSTLDIHCGGEDNKFPHHECEIAQSESATGQTLSRHWVHTAHLLVDGKRMAKSQGNFHTIRDVLKTGIDPIALRYALTCARYRDQLNYSANSLGAAETVVNRIKNAYLSAVSKSGTVKPDASFAPKEIADTYASAQSALCDDLNTPVAFASLVSCAKLSNQHLAEPNPTTAAGIVAIFQRFHELLGIGVWSAPTESPNSGADSDAEWIEKSIADRNDAKARGDYASADKIRQQLQSKDIVLTDTKSGTTWKKQ